MPPRNIIVTGIPRSGTTLVASLIDAMPDAVCLNEPAWHASDKALTAEDFTKWLVGEFAALRRKLRSGEAIPDRRAADGSAVTNYYHRNAEAGAITDTFRIVPFTRLGLSESFTLAVKHNAIYSSILPELIASKQFTIIAIVRHPLQVLHSWRSLHLPVSRGQLPAAMAYWPEVAQLVRSDIELLQKQVLIYDAFCKRYWEYRKDIHLIKYEELIADSSKLWKILESSISVSASNLIKKPALVIDKKISSVIEAVGEYYKHFYL